MSSRLLRASALCLVLVLVCSGAALADPLVDVSTVAVDTSMVGTLGATIVTALASLWGVRKVIKMVNRS